MIKHICILVLLSQSLLMAQQNFSILFDIEPTSVRGREIHLYEGYLYMVTGKLCFDPVRECGNVIKMDADGNIIWVKGIGAFDIGNSNRLRIVSDTITVTGHINNIDQPIAYYMEQISIDGDSLTSYFWPFSENEIRPPFNYGMHRKQDQWYLYGAGLQDDGQVDAVLLQIDTKGKLLSKNIWDDGYSEFQLGDLQENKNGELVCTAELRPQNSTKHSRAVIIFDDNLNHSILWESQEFSDLKVLDRMQVLDDGSYTVLTPNVEIWKASAAPMLFNISDLGEENWRFEFNHIFGVDRNRNIAKIKEAANGDILGVGYYTPSGGISTAWMFRISPQGELVWETTFKAYDWENGGVQIQNDLNDLVELDDGSIIGLGWQEENSLFDTPDDVWMIKVGPDGCLEEDCGFNQFTTSTIDSEFIKVGMYPNPVYDILYFEFPNDLLIKQIEVVDLNDQIVKTLEYNIRQIAVFDLEQSVYFLRLIDNKGRVSTKKFIKL